MEKIRYFKENGFYIEKSVTPKSSQEELFLIFYDLAWYSDNSKVLMQKVGADMFTSIFTVTN
jgi:hypothetical protein|tara:strand:- start:100 stop:285 length:186 start_codon:yes stop_codon:yes gene_type:complete